MIVFSTLIKRLKREYQYKSYSFSIDNNDISTQRSSIIDNHNSSIENRKTNSRQYFKEPEIRDVEKFIELSGWGSLEQGEITQLDIFAKEIYEEKGALYLLAVTNSVYIKYPDDSTIVCSILNVLSNYEYEELGSFLVTMCTAMLATGDQLVWEYATNAISVWNSKDFIPCLETISEKNDYSYLLKRLVYRTIDRIRRDN